MITFLLPVLIFWMTMAVVAACGYLAPYGKYAGEVVRAQASADDTTPLHVVADIMFACFMLTSPLAAIFSMFALPS